MPFGITVTVQRQTQDRFGNFTTASEHQVGPCAFEPTSTQELTDRRETVTRPARLFIPPGADIVPTDRIVLADGSRWSVVGDVQPFANPFTGWAPGGTVQIERVTG
jgi:hypothetical protein